MLVDGGAGVDVLQEAAQMIVRYQRSPEYLRRAFNWTR
jgi:hypothetical protein